MAHDALAGGFIVPVTKNSADESTIIETAADEDHVLMHVLRACAEMPPAWEPAHRPASLSPSRTLPQ